MYIHVYVHVYTCTCIYNVHCTHQNSGYRITAIACTLAES